MNAGSTVDWPLDLNRIRRGLINHTFGRVRRNADGTMRPHQGWDLFAAPGTPCFAVSDGSVKHIRTIGDYGNTIVLEFQFDIDGNGRPDTLYAAYSHLSRIDVKVGEKVRKGQQIGLTGNSGNATSMRGEDCHLHFELRTQPTPGVGLVGRLTPGQIFETCPLHEPALRKKEN